MGEPGHQVLNEEIAVFTFRQSMNSNLGTTIDGTSNTRNALTAVTGKLEQLGVDKAQINAGSKRGSGFGSFLGRLVTGRLRESSRREDSVVQEKFDKEVVDSFPEAKSHNEWIVENNEAIVNGDLQKQVMRDFSDAGVARMKELEDSVPAHDKDFFPYLYEKNENGEMVKVSDIAERDTMSEKNMSGLLTLGRQESRMSTARMYMLSKGYTVDEIFENSPEGIDRRVKCGKEMLEDIKKGPDSCGKMFAGMIKAYAELPVPDVSSDAAILKNMREIRLIRTAGKDMYQTMGERSSVEAAYEKYTTPEERARDNAAMSMGSGVAYLGCERADLIKSGVLHPEYKMPEISEFSQYAYGTFNQEQRGFIKENIKPGMKLGDCGGLGNQVMDMFLDHNIKEMSSGLDETGLRDKIINNVSLSDLRTMESAAKDAKNEMAADKEKSAKAFESRALVEERIKDHENERIKTLEEEKNKAHDNQRYVMSDFEMLRSYDREVYSGEPDSPTIPGKEIIIESDSLNISDFEKPQMSSSDFIKNESKEISIELNH
jgi:hypothetical protein